MGELQVDQELLDEVASRMDLRAPNREAIYDVALATSQHYDVDGLDSPYQCIVDSATGVGKTYVMGGLIEYFAGTSRPVRNFLLIAPGRAIRDKSIRNFTPGANKSLTAAMRSRPFLVTKDNFKSPATFAAMKDASVTKLYVFTVQALTSKEGDGRDTHEFQETLGCSFYEYLSGLGDLVVLADEHHCYRGPAFSRTIASLNPQLVVGLTATPVKSDEKMVVYRYPLAAAIHDELVKTPILVGRNDDRSDDRTKLLDGVTLLGYKQAALDAYCAEYDLPPVNPVMLVIARSTEEADEFAKIVESESFEGGAWIGTTLVVHSNLSGDDKENALEALESVEDPASPVRIIINVAILKEGWDVKNVYVIASMRASVSEVMTEQTLGRGMRLPFGRYTGQELLDSVEVLAHERYQELLDRRSALNESFISYRKTLVTRTLPDGQVVVRPDTQPYDGAVLPDPPASTGGGSTASGTSGSGGSGPRVVDLGTREADAKDQAPDDVSEVTARPVAGRRLLVPVLDWRATPAHVSLNMIDAQDNSVFEQFGRSFGTQADLDLRRTKIEGRVKGDKAFVESAQASGGLQAALTLDIPLDESRDYLVRQIMAMPQVRPSAAEVGAARGIVDAVVAGMGAQAPELLSAYPQRCAHQLTARVAAALKALGPQQVALVADSGQMVELGKPRTARRKMLDQHPDGAFASPAQGRRTAFGGWEKCLYDYAWFDSAPEYKVAVALDRAAAVQVWARLHINDVSITWTAGGRSYNPDFVVIEDVGQVRTGWLVETKGDDRMGSAEVAGKRLAAKGFLTTVNSLGLDDAKWRYLLLSETDVADADGSWDHLKSFGT